MNALLHHPEIAPQGELHAAGDRRSGNGGDHRLRQFEPARTHGSARRRAMFGKVEVGERLPLAELARGEFQIEAGAECAARAPKYRHGLIGIAIERQQGIDQRLGAGRIHGVSRLGAGPHDGGDRAVALDTGRHALLPCNRSPPM